MTGSGSQWWHSSSGNGEETPVPFRWGSGSNNEITPNPTPGPTEVCEGELPWKDGLLTLGIMMMVFWLAIGGCIALMRNQRRTCFNKNWQFHCKYNTGILLAMLNAAIMAGMAQNLVIFANESDFVLEACPLKYLGSRSGQALKAACIVLILEGLLTVIVGGLTIKAFAPWEESQWKLMVKNDLRWVRVLQVLWVLVFFASWVSRAVLVAAAKAYDHTGLPINVKNQLYGEAATSIIDTIFVLMWCASSTWCRKTEPDCYVCPVCQGTAANCTECVNGGVQYRLRV